MTDVNLGLPFKLWFSETYFWLFNKYSKLKADAYYTYMGVQI